MKKDTNYRLFVMGLIFAIAACGDDTPAPAETTAGTDTAQADTMTPEDTATPGDTTPPEPTVCETYCGLAMGNCTGDSAIYDSPEACANACEGITSNADFDMENPADEDSIECRIMYLHAAAQDASNCAAGGEDGGCVCITVTGIEPSGNAYSFPSKFAPFEGLESGIYNGQTMRQVLIEDLKAFIGSLTASIEDGSFEPTDEGEVVDALAFYYDFDAGSDGEEEFDVSTDPAPHQTTYNDLGNKNLKGKFAGNDSKTDHKDWTKEFKGWSLDIGDTSSPELLLTAWMKLIEANAMASAVGNNTFGVDGSGNVTDKKLGVHMTAAGHDLQQLIQKFLTMAVNFSQGADDYLDDDIDGKGLLAPNTQSGCKPYSKLAHHWDEGFGYFGAARDNDAYKACDIAGKCKDDPEYKGTYFDSNGDGKIDLLSEYNFGHSQNAAKRTYGSTTGVDFKTAAFDHFVAGRALINNAGAELTEQEMTDLKGHRDTVVSNWEKAVAATAIHYVNDTLGDMAKFGEMVPKLDDAGNEEKDENGDTLMVHTYSFTTHAKHWSELKGFALGLQFNPRSPLTSEHFVKFHENVGDAPVLPSATQEEIDAYTAALIEARDILRDAYGFDADDASNW
jgi:hypothetical protein